jgi:hypothetical protein
MTALAISGMMITGAVFVALFAVLMYGPVDREKHDWFVALFLLTFHLINSVQLSFPLS